MEATAAPTRADHHGDDNESDTPRCQNPMPYRILIEFAYKHVDFHLAELESILECNGILLLKNDDRRRGVPASSAAASSPAPRSPSALSATSPTGYCRIVPLPSSPSPSSSKSDDATDYRPPFVVLEFPSPQPSLGEALVAQCTLVRCAIELWGMGSTVESCIAATQHFSSDTHHSWVEPYQDADKSWKITVHALGSTISLKDQEVLRSRLQFLEFAGPVQLKDPHNEFVLLHEVRLDTTGPLGNPPPSTTSGSASVDTTTSSSSNSSTPNPTTRACTAATAAIRPDDLLACYFGRVLGGVRTTKGRAGLEQYTLKKRAYLGPTSMDAELAFVMASLAKVRPGSFVYDPFVGTGSILVACALKGASHVVGSDIDIRVLRGRGPSENIGSNFAQFNLPRPELLRTDNAIYDRHYRSHPPLYDAIVTDPPYGIRAGARKCGSRLDQPRPVPEDQRETHIAQTRQYAVSDVMADLLDVAARTLVLGGRLAYIIPSFTDFEPDNDLPRHDCLELVHSCFQPLQAELGRRVVVMQKVAEYDPTQRATYMSRIWKNGPESAEKVATLREKLHEAAKKKPRYEEKLAVRRQKRKQNRQAKKAAKKRELEEAPDQALQVTT